MADTLFDIAAESLERNTSFNRLESRGTLRIAIKAAGLEAASTTADQMRVVLEKVMPGELEKRDVSDAKAVCIAVAQEIASTPALFDTSKAGDLDEVFGRLGGD